MAYPKVSQPTDLDVVVIGAGFSGCYLLHKLRRQGFRAQVLEAGTTIGGVWCWNVRQVLPASSPPDDIEEPTPNLNALNVPASSSH